MFRKLIPTRDMLHIAKVVRVEGNRSGGLGTCV